MLHFNTCKGQDGISGGSATTNAPMEGSVLKILILDSAAQKILSPVMKVNDFRDHGVTLYLYSDAYLGLLNLKAAAQRPTSDCRCSRSVLCRAYDRKHWKNMQGPGCESVRVFLFQLYFLHSARVARGPGLRLRPERRLCAPRQSTRCPAWGGGNRFGLVF